MQSKQNHSSQIQKFITTDGQIKVRRLVDSKWFGRQVIFGELKTCPRWIGMNRIPISKMCWMYRKPGYVIQVWMIK